MKKVQSLLWIAYQRVLVQCGGNMNDAEDVNMRQSSLRPLMTDVCQPITFNCQSRDCQSTCPARSKRKLADDVSVLEIR